MLGFLQKIKICITLYLFICVAASAQNKVNIEGTVTDINNAPLHKVSVLLNKTRTTLTDERGHNTFTDVTEGAEYTIRFTHTGYEPIQQKVRSNHLDVTLVPSNEQLQTVEITGKTEKGYKNTVSFIGSKTATALKDIPQSISYVTKELMQDQGKDLVSVRALTLYLTEMCL